MTRLAGVLRSATSLATTALVQAPATLQGAGVEGLRNSSNLATVAQALTTAAIERKESRGSHTRIDFRRGRGSPGVVLSSRVQGHERHRDERSNWYPDPYGRHEMRYFDGAQWTEHVSSNGKQSVDPPAA